MKKTILSLAMLVGALTLSSQVNAQQKTKIKAAPPAIQAEANTSTAEIKPLVVDQTGIANTVAASPELMHVDKPVHDFGHLPEGPAAEYEFSFVNKGKEPIIISNVSASCGCTTPSYSKDPVLPGKKGTIKAAYSTQGRVGPFTKTITVNSNVGVKVLTIKGEVDKAPTSSVPENNSMMKTN